MPIHHCRTMSERVHRSSPFLLMDSIIMPEKSLYCSPRNGQTVATWILDLDDERCSGSHACVLGEIEGSLEGQDSSVLSFSPAIILIQVGVEHTVLDDEEWDAKNGRVDYSMCTTHVLPRPFHPKSCSLKFTAVCRYAWWSSAWL